MILATFTRQHRSGNKPQLDYQFFESIELLVDWFKSQGDKLTFSLSKKNRSFTQYGWVPKVQSSAQTMTAYDSTLEMVTRMHRITSDEGILFEDVKHCAGSIVDCMALKCVIQTSD